MCPRPTQQEEQPLVSVLMPLFNAAPYLAVAIDSVLAQSFDNFELVVIDDGSHDGSWDILKAFDDPRIRRFRHAENRGISVTMNEGLEASRGRYVAVMDADDICVEGRLECQVRHMESHPQHAACGMNLTAIGSNGKQSNWRYPTNPERIAAGMLFSSTVAHATIMARASFLRQHDLHYDETLRRAQDYELLARMTRLGVVCNLNRIGYIYRLHDSGKHDDWLSETNKTASRIRAGLASLLGFSDDNQDARLHDYIATSGRSGGDYSIREINAWLDRASRANRELGVWNPGAFDEVLRQHFFSLCINKACPLRVVWVEMDAAVYFGGRMSRVRFFRQFVSSVLMHAVARVFRGTRPYPATSPD